MKAILYAGAALMTGASIFGFVDYYKTKDNKDVAGLYRKETKADNDIKPASKVELVSDTKAEPLKEVSEATVAAKVSDVKKEASTKKFTKRKKADKVLTREMFSRAPLRESKAVKEKESEVLLPQEKIKE